jgi:hypothetical protein
VGSSPLIAMVVTGEKRKTPMAVQFSEYAVNFDLSDDLRTGPNATASKALLKTITAAFALSILLSELCCSVIYCSVWENIHEEG